MVSMVGGAADNGGECYSPIKEHAVVSLDGYALELAVVLCLVDAAEEYAACRGGYTVLPDAECSSGGIAVRLKLVVQGWECSVWLSESRAGRVAEDGFPQAGAETDDAIESIIEVLFGYIGYCHLDAGCS